MILTGKQIREGRRLAGLSETDLAKFAGFRVDLVIRAEQTDGLPMLKGSDLAVIQEALEIASVEFVPEHGGGAGVRLKKVEP